MRGEISVCCAFALVIPFLYYTMKDCLALTPLLIISVTNLEVVPIRVCNVTGHNVRVTHNIASELVCGCPTLRAWGYKWVRRVHTLPITLDLQEPHAGWEHLGCNSTHIETVTDLITFKTLTKTHFITS